MGSVGSCVLNDLRECIARIPAACQCQQMPWHIYDSARDKILGIDAKRHSILLAAGTEEGLELAPDLPVGSKSIGYYNKATKAWSEPTS